MHVLFLGLLTVCTALAMGQTVSTAGNTDTADLLNYWSFNNDHAKKATDAIQQKADSIFGNFEYVQGVSGKALKLDGFRTYISRPHFNLTQQTKTLTIESWIALAAYPWSWSPIADCSLPHVKGFFFGIDQEGHLGLQIAAGSSWYELATSNSIPLRAWTHVAAVFEADKKIRLFINGVEAASQDIKGAFVAPRDQQLTIGRNSRPQVWQEFQLTTPKTYFFLDCILDEVKISSRAKPANELQLAWSSIKNPPTPALSDRTNFPKGPRGTGEFGAYYSKLNYYKEWDDMWRVSEVPDVFVRFDQSPARLVFWRGTSFVPCWVTENNIWYTNEWLETWGSDVVSCAEPLMDRQCRYSHVRIIENTDARVVIHWRYALNDAFYSFVNKGDDGRGEWCDEFFTIYPDMVGIRKMELHYTKPERKHDWEEQIVVLPPGKYPDDVIDSSAITLVNMEGEVHSYSWHDKDLAVQMSEPRAANMSYVNLKSTFKPFFIIPPDPVKTVEGSWPSPFIRNYAAKMATGFRQDPVPSVYGWWNHWPVAQVPGDGRWVTTPDKPSHFSLTTFVQWKDYEYTERTRTRIMLQGLTNKKAAELVPLAKSWLDAPLIQVNTAGYVNGHYDQSERAYILEKQNGQAGRTCRITLEASKEKHLNNPAIIIKNWGRQQALITINNKTIADGEKCKQGIRKGPDGDDLILWLQLDSAKPVGIEVKRSEK